MTSYIFTTWSRVFVVVVVFRTMATTDGHDGDIDGHKHRRVGSTCLASIAYEILWLKFFLFRVSFRIFRQSNKDIIKKGRGHGAPKSSTDARDDDTTTAVQSQRTREFKD